MAEKIFFGEDKNIEFKRELPKNHEKFLKDIIAFSNCTGGRVILGIEDTTNIVYGIGNINPFRLSDNISNMISDACTPQIYPDITIQTLEGRTVLVIDVAPGRFRPYYLKTRGKENSSYVRINGTSRPADFRMLQELELEGQHIYYDSMPEIGMEYDPLKAQDLCTIMKKTALSACKTDDEKAEVLDMTIAKLEDIGLLCMSGRNYAPTHAFHLMTDNQSKYAKIQCALFKGTQRDEFIDRKEFKGPIYQQIDDAYQFVLRHINLSAEINGIIRRDVYELPVRAVREAITNAVTHRSYLDDSCIQISLFDDRLEILSPGMLYGGLDLKAALEGKSKCRNAAISEAFHYMGIIEAWGTGLGRIQKSCREYGLKKPVIEEFGNSFRVIFYRRNDTADSNRSTEITCRCPPVASGCSQTIRSSITPADCSTQNADCSTQTAGCSIQTARCNTQNAGCSIQTAGCNTQNAGRCSQTNSSNANHINHKVKISSPASISHTEKNIEQKLAVLLLENPYMTQQQAADKLGYSKAWIRKIMARLQQNGILHREGSTKKGCWIVSAENDFLNTETEE